MTKRVLLSPVGDTDPVRNQYDGPLLHIVRHYQPEKVYIFFTAEMERRSAEDNRYERCVHAVNPACDVEKIYSKIEAAHEFDQFNGRFSPIIDQIHTNHPDAEIILNISSATPQIQLALCLEAALGRFRCRAVQVATPAKSSNRDNRPEGKSFDVELQMETNLDQQNPDESNRCHEPDLLVVRRNNLRERIVSLIREYEYAGALAVAKTEGEILVSSVMALLEHAALRANLQTKAARKRLAVNEGMDLFPVKDVRAEILTEFFMVARIRQERNAVADFAMKLSPLLSGMIFFYIEDGLKYRWQDLAWEQEPNRYKLDSGRIDKVEPEFLRDLNDVFKPNCFRTADFSLFHAIPLLEYLKNKKGYAVDEKILVKFKELRHYEERVRHVAAHQIVPVTEATLQETAAKISRDNRVFRSHMTVRQLRLDIEELLKRILKGHGNQYRYIYDDINAVVEKKLS